MNLGPKPHDTMFVWAIQGSVRCEKIKKENLPLLELSASPQVKIPITIVFVLLSWRLFHKVRVLVSARARALVSTPTFQK